MGLEVDAVEVVWLDLDVSEPALEGLSDDLGADELARVARMSSPLGRKRAVARLGWRRRILAEHLGIAPSDVVYDESANGKPGLLLPSGTGLEFSASHRGSVGLLAIGRDRPLGVDVEAADEIGDVDALLRRVATPSEAGAIGALEAAARTAGMLRLWTRKEARLKATGEGIGPGLRHSEVPLDVAVWGVALGGGAGASAWLLYALDAPSADLAAALVVAADGRPPTVSVTARHETSVS